MILQIIKLIVILYLFFLFVFLFLKLSNNSKQSSGISSIFLFPLLLCTKKGRKTLVSEIKKPLSK